MRHISKWEVANGCNCDFRKFNFDDVKDKFTLRDLFNRIFSEFIDRFNFTTYHNTLNKCMAFIEDKSNGVRIDNLFDYTTLAWGAGVLFGEGLAYVTMVEYSGGVRVERKIKHDVYICEAEYCSLTLDKIAAYLFEEAFPFIKDCKEFNKEERKYPPCIHNVKETTLVTEIDSVINYGFEFRKPLLVRDLVKILTDPSEADKMVIASTIKVYSDGNIFIPSGNKDISLHMKSLDFIQKNWDEVKERNQWIGNETENPNPIIQKVKEVFFN